MPTVENQRVAGGVIAYEVCAFDRDALAYLRESPGERLLVLALRAGEAHSFKHVVLSEE